MVVNTPYDDVFKTLTIDCKELLLPIVNEVFHEHYVGDEEIVFHPDVHFLSQQNGDESKRITDTFFEIISKETKKYHFECQSIDDSTMLIRIFEYDTQIALEHGSITNSTLKVTFPNSAILYLRSSKSTPDQLHVHMMTPGGDVIYPIQVIKLKRYSLDAIFEKHLFFLLPFYIFVHESRFKVYNEDEQKRKILLDEFTNIKNRLEHLAQAGIISEYFKCTIIDMIKKVVEHLAKNHDNVREGVNSIMGGKVLEYEAKDILKRGISQGFSQGQFLSYAEMVRDGFIPISEAAKRMKITVEEFQKRMEDFK